MNDAYDDIASAAAGMAVFAIAAVIFIYMIILGVIGWLILRRLIRYLGLPQATTDEQGKPLPPARWFGAPPSSQWIRAYEYWLYQLEQKTGMAFTTSPAGYMVGAVVVTAGPALLLGCLLMVLYPASGAMWLTVLLGAAVVVGGLTGRQLAQPALGWFTGSSVGGGNVSHDSAGGFILGEEDW